ncbi:Crp/Fnr family transcriptional regulator [Crassaminicella profunda]|uniref:Crp/Fnr family transcriptional regulator n=1 Tax=Crassaminicella profunda TaxID=1286698 RepID=UPI001CA66867|nr:Crp/Fnr family transcriptional regulator [Crassaminicella profunda]QZY53956.1 Crp/Fnr family transcriptional regulator [Crassaminicella profunda]
MNKLFISLQNSNLFKGKSLNEIKTLLSKIIYNVQSYKENEIIFSPHQLADTMGIILSGSIDIEQLSPSGKIIILKRKNSPDLIAEPSLFSKSKYYPSTVAVYKSAKILLIHKNQLLKLFLIDNDIMLNFLESVSDSMLILKHKISILSLNSIQERIVAFLIHAYKNTNSTVITLPFSKKAWAEYINVSRTSLSRELRNLEIEGIISFDRHTIEIKDLEKLEEILF